jgi:hypothetical protein
MYTTNSKNTTRRRADLGGGSDTVERQPDHEEDTPREGFSGQVFPKDDHGGDREQDGGPDGHRENPQDVPVGFEFFARGEHEELIGLEEGACRFDLPVQSMSQTGIRHAHVDPPDCHVVDQVVVRPVPHVLQEVVAVVAQVLHLDVHLLGYGVEEFDRVPWVAAVERGPHRVAELVPGHLDRTPVHVLGDFVRER